MNTLAEYRIRAERFRPTSIEAICNAIEELAADGLKPRDISEALRLPLATVLDFLYEGDA